MSTILRLNGCFHTWYLFAVQVNSEQWVSILAHNVKHQTNSIPTWSEPYWDHQLGALSLRRGSLVNSKSTFSLGFFFCPLQEAKFSSVHLKRNILENTLKAKQITTTSSGGLSMVCFRGVWVHSESLYMHEICWLMVLSFLGQLKGTKWKNTDRIHLLKVSHY